MKTLLLASFWGILVLLYSLTLCQVPSASHDSINYLLSITHGDWAFHPHHLLFQPLSKLWMNVIQHIIPNKFDLRIIPALNMCFGLGTLGLFYYYLKNRLRYTLSQALTGVLLPALSFGMWFYSTSIEVYIIPLFFLMGAFYILSEEKITASKGVLLGLAHGCAILFHLVHVLFLIPILVQLLFANSTSKKRPVLSAYLMTVSVTTLIPYLIIIALVIQPKQFSDIYNWITSLLTQSRYWNSPLQIKTYLKLLIGWTRAFIGSHFIFALQDQIEGLSQLFKNHYLTDEQYLVRTLRQLTSIGLLISTIIWFISYLTLGLLGIKTYLIEKTHHKQLLLCLSWLIPYALFFSWWDAQNVEFWIPQLLCCHALFLIMYNHKKRRQYPLFILALALGTINYMGSFQFTKDPTNDFYQAQINALRQVSNTHDPIILQDKWQWGPYLTYFLNRPLLKAPHKTTLSNSEISHLAIKPTQTNNTVFLQHKPGYKNTDLVFESITPYLSQVTVNN